MKKLKVKKVNPCEGCKTPDFSQQGCNVNGVTVDYACLTCVRYTGVRLDNKIPKS